MTTHISDDLPRLLTGDATRDVVLTAANHLRTCIDCQQELVSAVVAHASLTSAHRFAPEIVAPGHDLDEDDELPMPSALPDLAGVFAEAHADAKVTPIKRMRSRRALIGVAAAAAIVVGGGITYTVAGGGDDAPTSRAVALTAFDAGAKDKNGSVEIVGNSTLKVDATKLPRLDKQHIYEVWLTDADRKNMQSVGFIGDDNTASLSVSPKWMSQYNDIEVSVQKVNQDKYSGTSVLRGSYG